MRLLINIVYLIAAVLFIFGIKLLQRVKTAQIGNLLAAVGMLLAILATLSSMESIGWSYIIAGIIIGGVIGTVMALKAKMTAMPQMVAILNGFGGAASALVAISYFLSNTSVQTILTTEDMITVVASVIIGTVTFTGSVVAFAKLQGLISSRPILFKGCNFINALLFIAILGLASWNVAVRADLSTAELVLWLLCAVASLLGILLVTPIGGADMPVVISLLNSYSGLAAASTGFVLKNNLLIITGALVGASGIILSHSMCKAMNRSLLNVFFGGFGQINAEESSGKCKQNLKECSVEEAALLFDGAKSVIIIPGYGMAVAQAQHSVHELDSLLSKKGIKVSYAIHPVAGRMPGHMNVLLAEANVPYEKLYEMDAINPEFKSTDVVLVVGANDIVNPAATTKPGSPIYGMPILKAYEAKTVLVIKRGQGKGFAGIENELFGYDNTLMLYGDAKEVILKVVGEVKQL